MNADELSRFLSFGFQIRSLVVSYRARWSSMAMLVRLTVLKSILHVTHDLFGVCKQNIIYRVHLFISIQRARKYRLRTLGVHKNSLNLNLHALQLTTSPIWQSFRQIVLCICIIILVIQNKNVLVPAKYDHLSPKFVDKLKVEN